MQKLMDLMFMSFKLQIISANSPFQLYNVCLNSFKGVEACIEVPEALTLVSDFKSQFEKRYSVISAFDYMIIKQVV